MAIGILARVIASGINRFILLIDDYSRSGRGNHQHSVVCAKHLVVDIDAHYGVCTQTAGTLSHFVHSLLTCLDQLAFIRFGTPAYKVAYARGKVLQEVNTGNNFSEDNSFVFPDCVAINGRCCCEYHIAVNVLCVLFGSEACVPAERDYFVSVLHQI